MATYMPKKQDVSRQWHCVDAEGKALGRLAVEVATLLRGKHKPQYSPHVDCGDFVVVVNADKIAISGQKAQQTLHYRHSGYPGGLKSRLLAEELEKHPDRVVTRAVKGMMPKNRLSRQMIRKLKVYAGPEHPHHAQFAGEPGEPGSGRNRRKKVRKAEDKAQDKAEEAKAEAEPKVEEPEPEQASAEAATVDEATVDVTEDDTPDDEEE